MPIEMSKVMRKFL